MRPTPASKTHHGARRSCAWCISACPWRATPTVSSGGQRLLPPRQPALGHGLLHLPAVEDVSDCVNMLENRPFENVGCALGSRRCENAELQGE